MKKLLFVAAVVVCLTIIFNVYFVNQHGKRNYDMDVRVGVVLDEKINTVDPALVKNLSQAFIVRNLYTPLLDYDEDAQIVSGLAESFVWDKNKLILSFGKRAFTGSGHLVGAEDALISLKRLMILGKNTHGNIAEFVCKSKTLKNINETCDGLYTQSGKLILEVSNSYQKEQLMTLLSSVDYRIIPKTALNLETLKIENFSETSGPYHLDNNDDMVLLANKHNYLNNSTMPKKIILVQQKGRDPIDSFIKNEIDVLPSFIPLTKGDIDKLDSSGVRFEVDKTHDISVAMWVFSEKAQKTFTAEDRLNISRKLYDLLGNNSSAYSKNTIEFFQDFGEGFLKPSQISEIEKMRISSILKFNKNVSVAIRGFLNINADSFFKKNTNFKRIDINTHPLNLSENERPDVFFGMADVAYKSTYSIMSYYIRYGVFGIFNKDANDWLEKYSNTEDLDKRNQLINELHFFGLKNVSCFPISVGPYITVTRNGWHSRMNKYFSITRLWTLNNER